MNKKLIIIIVVIILLIGVISFMVYNKMKTPADATTDSGAGTANTTDTSVTTDTSTASTVSTNVDPVAATAAAKPYTVDTSSGKISTGDAQIDPIINSIYNTPQWLSDINNRKGTLSLSDSVFNNALWMANNDSWTISQQGSYKGTLKPIS